MAETPEKAAEATYKAISDFVNAYRHHGSLVAGELLRDHKLLQSYTIELFVTCIKAMAEMDEDRITLQNRDAVDLCKRIMEVV